MPFLGAGTHLAQGGLYVRCLVLDLIAFGLGLELLQWSFVKQTLLLCWCDVPKIFKWHSTLLDILGIQMAPQIGNDL